jgi:enoyl-CoA hydratase/carnithine racemase
VTEFVKLEVEGGVGTIRLDRPPMNAISRQVQEELLVVAAEATQRADVRAVVLYGGEKVLAAGADVKEMANMTYADMSVVARRLSAGFGALASIPKPTVAAITGYALGGGLEVALGCDRRICGDNAKLGQPEILLGIIPGGGGTQRLTRLIGAPKAKDLIFTGRKVEIDEAVSLGIVDRKTTADRLLADAQAWAAELGKGSATALALGKTILNQSFEMSAQQVFAQGSQAQGICYTSTEHRESVMAFLAKSGASKQ